MSSEPVIQGLDVAPGEDMVVIQKTSALGPTEGMVKDRVVVVGAGEPLITTPADYVLTPAHHNTWPNFGEPVEAQPLQWASPELPGPRKPRVRKSVAKQKFKAQKVARRKNRR